METIYDLNIGNEILEHLTIEDGIREFISNALDEHIINNINKEVKIYKENKQWIIKDYGTGLKRKNFKFNINKIKSTRNDVIGMFGVGLKDGISILTCNNIEITIITNRHIFRPFIKERDDGTGKTIQIDIKRNNSIELDENCGTEIRLTGCKDSYIEKAKNKFLYFLKPLYLYENGENKIFHLPDKQYIYINGVEVYENSKFHFSYNIESNNEIKKLFNRDRKYLDRYILKDYIKNILENLTLYNDNGLIINEILYNYIKKDLLTIDSEKKLGEFSNKSTLRNIVKQINDNEHYLFVGKTEKLNKYDKEIKNCGCIPFILGGAIKSKFKIKNIKNLHNIELFMSKKFTDEIKPIHTLLAHSSIQDRNNIIKQKVNNMLISLSKLINIPEELKEKLQNITVDESLNDDEFDFKDKLLVSDEINDNKLAGIIFEYILNTINSSNKDEIYRKLGELLINSKKSWFSFW